MERVITIATIAHTGGYKRMDKAFYSVTLLWWMDE
jgi:hypothetical protein